MVQLPSYDAACESCSRCSPTMLLLLLSCSLCYAALRLLLAAAVYSFIVAVCLPPRVDTRMVVGVGWTPSNELLSVGDDKVGWRWSLDGEAESKLLDGLDAFVTDFKWLTTVRGGNVAAEMLVLGCSDGTIRFYNALGRHEKTEKAHKSECNARDATLEYAGCKAWFAGARFAAQAHLSACLLSFYFVRPAVR